MEQVAKPSIDLVFELTKNNYEMVSKWADSLDNKATSIFSIGALLISVITAIGAPEITFSIQTFVFVLAVLAFIGTAIFAWEAYHIRDYIAILKPNVLLEEYASLDVQDAKYWLVKYASENYEQNKTILDDKAENLHISMICVGIEVISLVIWIVIR